MRVLSIKFFCFLFILVCCFSYVQAYDVQPGDNTILNTMYDRIDEQMHIDETNVLEAYKKIQSYQIRYFHDDRTGYFLEKILEYLEERLFRANEAEGFECFQEYVQQDDTVTLRYSLFTNDGKFVSLSSQSLIEVGEENKPLVFTVGQGKTIRGVDEAVFGKKQSQRRGTVIPSSRARGSPSNNLAVRVSYQQLSEYIGRSTIDVGDTVILTFEKNNKQKKLTGKVLVVHHDSVLIDFNNPLAGEEIQGIFQIQSLFKACR